MKKACLFGGALFCAGIAGGQQVTIVDQLDALSAPDYAYGGPVGYAVFGGGADYGPGGAYGPYGTGAVEVDRWAFEVTAAGNFQFDMLSSYAFDNFFDTYVRLYEDDGNPLSSANRIGQSDDFSGTDFNGSIDSLDSYLDIFLTEGDYILAVGPFFLSDNEADMGSADAIFVGPDSASFASYRLDVLGDGQIRLIPTPAGAAIVGLSGLAAVRRRR